LIQPRPKRVIHAQGGYRGVVTATGPDWVELGPGWTGTQDDRKQEQADNKKPKRISAARTPAGGDPEGAEDVITAFQGNTHLVADLEVGDVVDVITHSAPDGEEWTAAIIIFRRPGGKIPPMPADAAGFRSGTPERNQAEQDWEEKGIPIPKKFLNPQGRAPWTNPPYPPVAPAPRPAPPGE
jgi:hypothetical protein